MVDFNRNCEELTRDFRRNCSPSNNAAVPSTRASRQSTGWPRRVGAAARVGTRAAAKLPSRASPMETFGSNAAHSDALQTTTRQQSPRGLP